MTIAQPAGCLAALPPFRWIGAKPSIALPDRLALPTLDTSAVPRDVLPVAIRIRTAARACHKVLRTHDFSRAHCAETMETFVGWIGDVYDLMYALVPADAFVAEHATDQMAQRQAEMELELVGAPASEIQAIRAEWASLKARFKQVPELGAALDQTRASLREWAECVESLHGRLDSEMGQEVLLHECRAWRRTTGLTAEELARLLEVPKCD